MKFLKLQNTKFTLLLISALGTASCVFLPQSLILHKENRISLFSQNSVGFPPSSLTDKIPWEELSYLAKQGLSETKSNLQKIILDYKKFPISEDFLSFVNDNIKQIEQDEDYDDYRDIKRIQRIFLLHNYKIWKQAFLNSDDLVLTSEDKDEWKKIFIQKSNEIKTLSEQNQTINSQNYLKDFYIYKLKEQIKLYEKYPYYLQPLERLKKILYYYQNNYGEFVDFQWGIDKNGKFSLEPSKYYSGNYQRIKINDEYIKNWIKYYQRWNWVFVKTDDQISKIEDKDILALQIDKKFKDNKIISDYLERQINFQPNRYFELWNINEQHPEKVNYNDVKQKGLRIFSGYYNKEISVISEINKLNLSKVSFQKPTVNFKKDLFDNKEYEFLDWSSIKKFDYKKFYNYQKLVEIKDEYSLGSIEGFSIYNNLLFEKPNLFSDGLYKSINSELIKPVQIRKKKMVI
ncbi:Uncharacterised protein [Mycoplasmopsis citelli]|uniref:Lipoprotein n=1 Tax=Mycoplasmopsis citelli TaxID=171281 RepID=A0A449B2T4_9BACT|nr:hypothetical protein [Mycoplasmopsis citelli]VEU74908.1 Uncharacterised protein [Mycoplasmopsis citelli]